MCLLDIQTQDSRCLAVARSTCQGAHTLTRTVAFMKGRHPGGSRRQKTGHLHRSQLIPYGTCGFARLWHSTRVAQCTQLQRSRVNPSFDIQDLLARFCVVVVRHLFAVVYSELLIVRMEESSQGDPATAALSDILNVRNAGQMVHRKIFAVIVIHVVPSLQATSTHPYWAHHPDELWRRFLAGLKQQLSGKSYGTVCRVLAETWQSASAMADDPVQFELELIHDCAAVACTDGTCALCRNSASRRCPELLSAKYLVKDSLVPACGAPATIYLRRTGLSDRPVAEKDFHKLPPFVLQV